MDGKDTYKTLAGKTEAVLLKERKSKFYGYAFPLKSEEEVSALIDGLRKLYTAANHFCYAWQLGVENVRYRTNDDGEPYNSAGAPIYGQIQSFALTNVLVVVVRVFGGVKLGVGGLVTAYRGTAKMALENGKIVTKTVKDHIHLRFGYAQMSLVMRFIKKNGLTVVGQDLQSDCTMVLAVRRKRTPVLMSQLRAFDQLEAHLVEADGELL